MSAGFFPFALTRLLFQIRLFMFGSEEGNENQKGAAARAWLGAGDGDGALEASRRAQGSPGTPLLERRVGSPGAGLVRHARSTRHCTVLHSAAWHCTVPQGAAWHCTALHGAAWHCSSPPLGAPLAANLTAGETSTLGICSTS